MTPAAAYDVPMDRTSIGFSTSGQSAIEFHTFMHTKIAKNVRNRADRATSHSYHLMWEYLANSVCRVFAKNPERKRRLETCPQ